MLGPSSTGQFNEKFVSKNQKKIRNRQLNFEFPITYQLRKIIYKKYLQLVTFKSISHSNQLNNKWRNTNI